MDKEPYLKEPGQKTSGSFLPILSVIISIGLSLWFTFIRFVSWEPPPLGLKFILIILAITSVIGIFTALKMEKSFAASEVPAKTKFTLKLITAIVWILAQIFVQVAAIIACSMFF